MASMIPPDFIAIQEAEVVYKRSIPWFYDRIKEHKLRKFTIPGDKKTYLLRSEIQAILQPYDAQTRQPYQDPSADRE